MVTISYAILVNDEYEEIKQLIEFLLQYKKISDEIVIVQDLSLEDDLSDIKLQVNNYLKELSNSQKILYFTNKLNNDFSQQKNYLTQKCTKDYIFNIDADELPVETLMENLHELIEANLEIDVLILPRINKVDNITTEHITKWGWNVDEKNRINWPDWQWRIYKNNDNIKWKRRVHEYLEGYKTFSSLPKMEEYAIKHFKKLNKQEKQNKHYEQIIKGTRL